MKNCMYSRLCPLGDSKNDRKKFSFCRLGKKESLLSNVPLSDEGGLPEDAGSTRVYENGSARVDRGSTPRLVSGEGWWKKSGAELSWMAKGKGGESENDYQSGAETTRSSPEGESGG